MKNYITFVIFGQESRYWMNVPYLLVVMDAIYPNFIMRFYLHESCPDQYLDMLNVLAFEFDKIEIEHLPGERQGTRWTNWRMCPIWEEGSGFLLCRDVDYVPTELERRAVEYFFRSSYILSSLRSYHLHTTPYMAGMTGYRCPEVFERVVRQANTFNKYMDWGHEFVKPCEEWIWGCDQSLPRDFFRLMGLHEETLDCPQLTAPESIANYNPKKTLLVDEYPQGPIDNCNMDVLAMSSKIAGNYFTGQPQNVTTDDTKAIIEIANSQIGRRLLDYV